MAATGTAAEGGGEIDDDLWSAVGDPTRRRMLDLLLSEGSGTATGLSERLPVTRQAVAKHLAVLDRAGLVHAAPAGREKRFRVDEEQLARAVAQLTGVGAAWDNRLRRIRRIAETVQRRKDAQEAPDAQEAQDAQDAEDAGDDRDVPGAQDDGDQS
ncbi:ArsR/SmtB family transcription factor [Streptomyces sp. NPDC020983]|uniref:ArsR/SmtB family transcription factor n=1 Tax=Streptomyces sp. NPDC020983 TaxID=3365106 RepID=UPI0037B4A05F